MANLSDLVVFALTVTMRFNILPHISFLYFEQTTTLAACVGTLWLSAGYITNRIWSSVVCTLINDTRRESTAFWLNVTFWQQSIWFFLTTTSIKKMFFFFRARAEKGIAWHTDATSVVSTLIDHGKLVNHFARLEAIVVKIVIYPKDNVIDLWNNLTRVRPILDMSVVKRMAKRVLSTLRSWFPCGSLHSWCPWKSFVTFGSL